MGHYTIDKYKIFYSRDRFAEIDDPYLATLDPLERIGINMLGMDLKPRGARLELDKLHIATLEADYQRLSQESFEDKWVKLSFNEKEASVNSWEIIYDYFHIFKNGKIKDKRDFGEKIADSYTGQEALYQQGKIVELTFNISTFHENLWDKLIGKKSELIKELDLKSITAIEGTLTSLRIDTPKETLYLSDTIRFVNKSADE